MNQPYLISGQTPPPNPYQGQPGGLGASRLVKIIVTLWLLAGIGYLGWRLALQTRPAAVAPAPVSAAAALTAISSQDLEHHMQSVNGRISNATARLKRAEDLIAKTLPSLERNYLIVDKQHLETALAATEAARRDLEQSRQDADLILNSLKENQLK